MEEMRCGTRGVGSPLGLSACRLLSAVLSGFAVVATVITLILPFPVLYEVVAQVLHNPPTWVFEVSGYAMIMLALAACGYGLHTGHHFRINVLVERVPSAERSVRWACVTAELVFGGLLFVAGVLNAHSLYTEGVRSNTLLQVPLVWPELALPIGGLTIFLRGILGIFADEGRNRGRPTC